MLGDCPDCGGELCRIQGGDLSGPYLSCVDCDYLVTESSAKADESAGGPDA